MVPPKYHFMSIRKGLYNKEVTVMNLYELCSISLKQRKHNLLEICEETMGKNVTVLFLGQNKEKDAGWCFAFFYGMTSQVQPQDEIEHRLRETKYITLMGPRDRRSLRHTMQGHMGKLQGGQEVKNKEKI